MTWDMIPREAIVFACGVGFLLVAAGLTWLAIVATEHCSRRRPAARERKKSSGRY